MPDAVWVGGYSYKGLNHCGTCGANVERQYMVQHENFHLNYTYRRDHEVSKVVWCDYGDHAFKAGMPGSASFDASEVDEETGGTIRTTMDACGEHNPLNVQRQAARYGLTTKGYQALTDVETDEVKS